MKYIYGPLNSRRLGLSLGLSLSPYKACNLDCVYCQLGKNDHYSHERREYAQIEEIAAELESWLRDNPVQARKLKFITFSGLGEPTLNSRIGELIGRIKKMTSVPLAVITNSTLLGEEAVRKELLPADLIVPSLDAANEEVFAGMDRPHKSVKLGSIIEGLVALRKEFKGKIWLEVMLLNGINDGPEQIKELKMAIARINPDKIQLNSPVRAPAGSNVRAVSIKELEKIKKALGEKAEII